MLLKVCFGPGTPWGWLSLRLRQGCWLFLMWRLVGDDVVEVVLKDLWELVERKVEADFVDDWIKSKGWVSCQ